MTQISITRALAEVKQLNDRIERGTRSTVFITTTVGGKMQSGQDKDTVTGVLAGNLQSVQALIARRKVLKSAVVRSNAITEVVINSSKMTVAEAIERKASIQLEKNLLTTLRQQLAQVQGHIERGNVQMQARLDSMILTAVGKDRKATEDEIDAISKPFVASNKTEALDPSNLPEVVRKLEADIEGFELEVDFALSESNARTTVAI
ncbi:hypothetical protein D3C80_882280 [compost metagenome]